VKKLIALFITLCMVGCSSVVRYSYVVKDPVDANNFYNSVAIVSVEHNGKKILSGTAFAYDKDHLLTAAHICLSAAKLQIFLTRQQSLFLTYTTDENIRIKLGGVEINNIFTTDDICMLKRPNHGLKPVNILGDYSKVKIKDRVFIVGAPVGVGVIDFHGKVISPSSYHGSVSLRRRLIVSAAITGGSSGSPVFNLDGEVIGILIMGHLTFDHLGVCVPSSRIHDFLKKHNYQ
jgi:S1-C subfamily serine protease